MIVTLNLRCRLLTCRVVETFEASSYKGAYDLAKNAGWIFQRWDQTFRWLCPRCAKL